MPPPFVLGEVPVRFASSLPRFFGEVFGVGGSAPSRLVVTQLAGVLHRQRQVREFEGNDDSADRDDGVRHRTHPRG